MKLSTTWLIKIDILLILLSYIQFVIIVSNLLYYVHLINYVGDCIDFTYPIDVIIIRRYLSLHFS